MNMRLRAIEISDLENMLAWENDESAWEYSDTVAPLSRRMLEEYILTYDADPYRAGQLRLVLDRDGEAAGLFDLYGIKARHGHAFVGVYVDARYRKSGLGREGLQLLCDYADNHLGLKTLAAYVSADNEASVRLFRSADFTESGRLPAWRRTSAGPKDVLIFSKKL